MSTDPLGIGLSGLEAYSTAIDVSANNVANVGTSGFQAQDVEFQNIFEGVRARITTNSTPGGLDPTGTSTGVAISGPGFFVLAGPSGNTTYTRAGDFVVDANGTLVDAASGMTVRSAAGGPITVPAGVSALSIAPDGVVSGAVAGGASVAFGRIALAVVQNAGGLIRAGGGYQSSANSGSVLLGAPSTPGYGSLVSGFVESSNVGLSDEFVKMIASQNAFDANAKTIRTADEMLKTTINLGAEESK